MSAFYPRGGGSGNGGRQGGRLPGSTRLRYRRLAPEHAEALQRIALDPHVRRFLLDGAAVPPNWSAEEVARSEALFAECGVGLWMVWEAGRDDGGAACGFVGFRRFAGFPREVQLVYALVPEATGRGYATEAAGAALRFATAADGPGLAEVDAAVDAPNVASARVLEKLGFERTGDVPGAFGRTFTFRWRAPARRSHGSR